MSNELLSSMSTRLKILIALAGVALVVGLAVLLGMRAREGGVIPGSPNTLVLSGVLPITQEGSGSVPNSKESASSPAVGTPATSDVGSEQTSYETLPAVATTPGSIVELSVPASEEEARLALSASARMIAERFGTYSTQNAFANLRDLQPFMTSSLSTWLEGYIAKEAAKRQAGSGYSATTTVALRANVSELNLPEGKATVVVQTSKTNTGSSGSTTSKDSFEVKFLREGQVWKIDNVRWVR